MIVGFEGGGVRVSHISLDVLICLVALLSVAEGSPKLHLGRLRLGKFDTYNTFRLEAWMYMLGRYPPEHNRSCLLSTATSLLPCIPVNDVICLSS